MSDELIVIDNNEIQRKIFTIRGLQVMLDSDLADMYGVETKNLNRAVSRNIARFPEKFRFQLTKDEFEEYWDSLRFQFDTLNDEENLRCQIGTSSLEHGGRRYQPLVFTENGVAMLSSILRSPHAIEVNIAIMRIFTKLRSYLLLERDLTLRMDKLEDGTTRIFKTVFERLDDIDEKIEPSTSERRRKIGLK